MCLRSSRESPVYRRRSNGRLAMWPMLVVFILMIQASDYHRTKAISKIRPCGFSRGRARSELPQK